MSSRLRAALSPAVMMAGLLLAQVAPAQVSVRLPERIVFGQSFELTIESVTPFDEAALAPLVVERLASQPTASGERHRLRARCYTLGEVVLALQPPIAFRCHSCLPEPPADLEWPGDGWALAGAPRSIGLWIALLSVAGLSALLWWRWLRNADAAAGPDAATAPAAAWDAQLDLQALSLPGGDRAAVEAYYRELKAIVRRHCAERWSLPAAVRTSEELVRALPRDRDRLAPCFSACDLVLFAAFAPAAGAHVVARDRALQFVQATEGGR